MANQTGQMGNQQGMMQRNGREGWGSGWAMLHRRFGHEREEAIMGIATALASGSFYRFRRGPDEVHVALPATTVLAGLRQRGDAADAVAATDRSPLATGGTH